MRIILNTVFDNDKLPVTYPEVGLINPNLLAGYNMKSNRDFSGNGNHFSWGGAFNPQGATLTPDAASHITTPIMDTAELTVIICANIATTASNGIILSNAQPTPTQGFEIRKRANLADAQLQIAISNGSGFATGSFNFSGWRMNIFTLDSAGLKASLGAGTQTSLNFGGTRRLGLIPWHLNGLPEGYGAGGTVNGCTGTLGMALFYDKVFTQAELVPLAASVRQVMSLRGIAV